MNASKRILIVDDDPEIHGLLSAALSAPQREIESAYDGLEALRRMEAAQFDLVLTDVNMPGLDGLALLERIQKERPGTRVAVMTVANTPETIVHAIRERAFTYFCKPFTIEAVIDIVESALQSSPGEDDIEVLSARPNWLALRLRCKMETGDRILQFLQAMGAGRTRGRKWW
jgi:DNA-binding NtrC family response regulator